MNNLKYTSDLFYISKYYFVTNAFWVGLKAQVKSEYLSIILLYYRMAHYLSDKNISGGSVKTSFNEKYGSRLAIFSRIIRTRYI